jgi:ATP-dependent Clp protease ATP-binding subunit ClpA
MPKINVYLPDELAAAVKEAGFPVSPVCQQALAEAVRLAARVRRTTEAIRGGGLDLSWLAAAQRESNYGLTARLHKVLGLAAHEASATAPISSGRLLLGLLDEGSNLGVSLMRSLDVDIDELRAAAENACSADPEAYEQAVRRKTAQAESEDPFWQFLTWPARMAIACAMESSVSLAHKYVGCEHLLLGLLDDEGSQAGRVLRRHGLDPAATRRAMTSALAGYAHGSVAKAQPSADKLDDIGRRLEAIEGRLTAIGA